MTKLEELVEEVSAEVRIRVAIVDDHQMILDGLSRVVLEEEDLELVGVASTVADAVELARREAPDVVLMDFHLPDGDGAIGTERILSELPATKVIMLSASGANDVLARAVEAGCAGLIVKDRAARDVVDAIRAAARGESVLRAADLAHLLRGLKSEPQPGASLLSARELEVLRLLAKGKATDAIAKELFLSVHTVRNHIRNVLTKLGAHSKLEALAIAARDGVVSIDEIG